jgi:hypothetical protein
VGSLMAGSGVGQGTIKKNDRLTPPSVLHTLPVQFFRK